MGSPVRSNVERQHPLTPWPTQPRLVRRHRDADVFVLLRGRFTSLTSVTEPVARMCLMFPGVGSLILTHLTRGFVVAPIRPSLQSSAPIHSPAAIHKPPLSCLLPGRQDPPIQLRDILTIPARLSNAPGSKPIPRVIIHNIVQPPGFRPQIHTRRRFPCFHRPSHAQTIWRTHQPKGRPSTPAPSVRNGCTFPSCMSSAIGPHLQLLEKIPRRP